MTATDLLEDTYVAALQHDLVDVPAEATLVGVVRRPTGWFRTTVDENYPALGPPEALLDEFKRRHEDFKMRGMCDEGAHNAAWDEVGFDDRYRTHLAETTDAREAVAELTDRLRVRGTPRSGLFREHRPEAVSPNAPQRARHRTTVVGCRRASPCDSIPRDRKPLD